MHADSERLNDLSGQMIGWAFGVLDAPGAGLLEKVDENAPAFAVRARACPGEGRGPIGCAAVWPKMYDRDVVAGDDFVDPRVENARPAALKTVKALDDARMPSGFLTRRSDAMCQ